MASGKKPHKKPKLNV